jgi:hypothetical protein
VERAGREVFVDVRTGVGRHTVRFRGSVIAAVKGDAVAAGPDTVTFEGGGDVCSFRVSLA